MDRQTARAYERAAAEAMDAEAPFAPRPNRKSRRNPSKAKLAKPPTASTPQLSPEQMVAQLYAAVFQQAHQTLQIVNTVYEQLPEDREPGTDAELYSIRERLRRELLTAGLGLVRPMIAKLKAQTPALKAEAPQAVMPPYAGESI